MPVKKEELSMLIKEEKKPEDKHQLQEKQVDVNGSLDISPINKNVI